MSTRTTTCWLLFFAGLVLLVLPSPSDSQPGSIPLQIPPTFPPGTIVPSGNTLPKAGPPTPYVTLYVHVDDVVMPGKELQYRIVVANPTQAPAHHVLLRCKTPSHARYLRAEPKEDVQSPELRWKLGTLAAGARQEVVLDVMPNGEGDVDLVARVQFEHGQAVKTRLGKSTFRVQINGPKETTERDVPTFRISVTNTGRTEAEEVVLSYTLPPELELAVSKPAETSKKPLFWKLGTLEPGETKQVECQLIAKRTGTVTHRAEVRDTTGGVTRVESTLVIGEPKLTLDLRGPATGSVNTKTTYELVVTNRGSSDATNVVVRNPIPREITLVAATPEARRVGDVVTWSLGRMAPGTQKTLTVTIQASVTGNLKFGADVQADGGVLSDDEVTTEFIGSSGFEIKLNREPTSVLSAAARDKTTMTIRIHNTGTGNAKNTSLTVQASRGLKITSFTPKDSVLKFEFDKIVFNPIPTLAPGTDNAAVYTVEFQGVEENVNAKAVIEVNSDQLKSGAVKKEENIGVVP